MGSVATLPIGAQFGRKAGLVVSNKQFIKDLSDLRFTFSITNNDTMPPNRAEIRVYNVSPTTAKQITQEFTQVSLQGGYGTGNFGIIFSGDIKRFYVGKERNTDTYLGISASDGDLLYNFGIVNASLKGGSTPAQRLDTIIDALNSQVDTQQQKLSVNPTAYDILNATGGILPRGKVLFGMARAYLDELANTAQARWSIQNGQFVLVQDTSFLPGTIITLNSQTGLIGQPEATDQGIQAKTLLNPLIRVGSRVQINNELINKAFVTQSGRETGYPNYGDLFYPATATNDGIYRVLVAEHSGDSRGNEWITDITCLSVDPSAAANNSVQAGT
jgi:hypothetical protein